MPAPELIAKYRLVKTGLVKTTGAAVQLSDVSGRLVNFKAAAGNSNVVYVGGSGVTIPSGTADTTTGFPLAAGAETRWIPMENLNEFYVIGGTPNDQLHYLIAD